VTARPDDEIVRAPADLADVGARLPKLADLAANDPTAAAWLEETLRMIFAVLVELEERREGYDDPRRQKALRLGERIARAKAAGASIEQLSERFGRDRSRIYRLLGGVAQHRATVSRLTLNQQPEEERRNEFGFQSSRR
jgi:hypothetical protein